MGKVSARTCIDSIAVLTSLYRSPSARRVDTAFAVSRCVARSEIASRTRGSTVRQIRHGVVVRPATRTVLCLAQPSTARQGGRRCPGSAVWTTTYGGEAAHHVRRLERTRHGGPWRTVIWTSYVPLDRALPTQPPGPPIFLSSCPFQEPGEHLQR